MILESIIIVISALILDFFIGDPKTKYHPTAWMGRLIALLVPFTKSNSAKKLTNSTTHTPPISTSN